MALAVGPELIVVGLAAFAAGWFYTGGSHPYGYYGFGELFVFVFFGLVATVGSAALLAKAPNPHSALLFIDYLLSKEGQQLIMKGGLWSPREDTGSLDQKFKKSYLDEKYSSEEMESKLGQWENIMRQLVMRKR